MALVKPVCPARMGCTVLVQVLMVILLQTVSVSAEDTSTHPVLMGFDGSRLEYKGQAGKFCNLMSDEITQLNALLIEEKETGKTFIGAIGLITAKTRVKVLSLRTDHKMVVEVNDMVLKAQEKLYRLHSGLAIKYQRNDLKQEVDIRTHNYVFSIRMINGAYLDLRRVIMMRRPTDIHGVLGQTARSGRPQKKDGYLEGEVEEYYVSGLWAGDFPYNRYDVDIADMVSESLADDGPTLANRIYDIDGHRKKWEKRKKRREERMAEREYENKRLGGLDESVTEHIAAGNTQESMSTLGNLLGGNN